jgi:hypothetical protein
VNEAILNLDNATIPLSQILRKAIRVARLRNDFMNLWWLENENQTIGSIQNILFEAKEIAPYLSEEQFKNIKQKYLLIYNEERQLLDDNTGAYLSIEEIEAQIEHFSRFCSDDKVTMDTSTASYKASKNIVNLKSILSRVRQRVADFLNDAEKQLLFGQESADIFELNREYVDSMMLKLCPEALKMFTTAIERVHAGTEEARSHALTTCRRIIKALADTVYPATDKEIIGIDKKKRKMSDDNYIARLWQFVSERSSGSRSGNLILSSVNDLGNRIDTLYRLSCKGVHEKVTDFEVNQSVIQMYILVGDILRLHERTATGL